MSNRIGKAIGIFKPFFILRGSSSKSFLHFFSFCFWWRNFNSFCCVFLLDFLVERFTIFHLLFSWIWLSGIFSYCTRFSFLYLRKFGKYRKLENSLQFSSVGHKSLWAQPDYQLVLYILLSLSLFSLLWIFCISLASLLVSQGNSPGAWKTQNAKCRDKETKSLGIFCLTLFSVSQLFSPLS